MKTFFTADQHFGHSNILKYCNRPFKDVEEMNATLIQNWNSVVSDNDEVFVLGDFALCKPPEMAAIFKQLNGARKILIRGNHDRSIRQMLEVGFHEVHSKLEWKGWTLQHHPPEDTNRKTLCGHVHQNWVRKGWTVNVGVDVWNFKPVASENLLTAVQS